MTINRVVLPIVTEKNIILGKETWSVHFYEEYSSLFIDTADEWRPDFLELLSDYVSLGFENNFRVKLNYRTVPLLASIFFDKKTLLISSHQASRELFLLDLLKEVNDSDNKDISANETGSNLTRLQNHINEIISLDPKTFPVPIEMISRRHKLPDLINNTEYPEVEKVSRRISKHLLDELNRYRPSFLEKLTDYSLNLTANYAILRVHLLKFLAILPALDYDHKGADVKRLFLESIRRTLEDSETAARSKQKGIQKALPFYLLFVFNLSGIFTSMLPCRLFAFFVRSIATSFAHRFIAGETIEKSKASLGSLRATGRDATVDQLGELVVSEQEADNYCNNVINIIKGLSRQIKRGTTNDAGLLKASVSIKVSALSSDFKPEAFEYSYNSVAPRLKKILFTAKNEQVFINVDAEHYSCRDLIFKIFKRVLLENGEFKDMESIGIVVQAYLRDAYPHFLEILDLAKSRNIVMPVRLVKGAYWDAESIEAEALNFNAPEFLNKEESDLHFRQLIVMIMKNYPHVQLCLASHNLQDHCFAEGLRHLYFSDIPKIEHQCLYMTCEALSVSMATMQWVTRNYVPIGNLLVGMGYLVRRIMENSSLVGVLTVMRSHKMNEISKEPGKVLLEKRSRGEIVHDHSVVEMSENFSNVAPVQFYLQEQMDFVAEQLGAFSAGLGEKYKQGIEMHGDLSEIKAPSDPEIVVGKIQLANKDDVAAALDLSYKTCQDGVWSELETITRTSILLKVADNILLRRVELASLIVYEGGKCIREALADVDEAIDFLNFYARQEICFIKTNPSAIPRGVFVVISPWNFPLAIPCGMVTAALVAGNSVVFKSSTRTPLIGQVLTDIFHIAGVPKEVLIHISGSGDEVGSLLVNNQAVNGVVFTGSKIVGRWIARQSCKRLVSPIKSNDIKTPVKVITEMGGKNAIIITANAELDEVVTASLYSCFGHAGQKCSAASRILVDERIVNRFVERFSEACLDIRVGKSYDLSSTINPVICQHDKERLIREGKEAIDEAVENGGKVLVNRLSEELPGNCVAPLVLFIPAELAMTKNSYAHKELFGPIIHVIPFKGLDNAIKIVNSSEYALTNGIFSQSQDDIEYITSRIEAGNLYVNRGCTGARVSIEPFGGFKLSGTGPKAGHRNYLNAFHLISAKDMVILLESSDEERNRNDEVPCVYELAEKSRLALDERITIIKNVLLSVDANLEDVFNEIPSIKRVELTDFANWLELNLEQFLCTKQNNRNIPGQLSYNDHSMIKEKGLLVASSMMPSTISFYNLVSALAVGSGVTLFVENMEAYVMWQTICEYFIDSGIPAENLQITSGNDEDLVNLYEKYDLSFVIIDGNAESIKNFFDLTLKVENGMKYMRSIHTQEDGPTLKNWPDFLLQFIFVRSMAINTMRHGAPLEIETL